MNRYMKKTKRKDKKVVIGDQGIAEKKIDILGSFIIGVSMLVMVSLIILAVLAVI